MSGPSLFKRLFLLLSSLLLLLILISYSFLYYDITTHLDEARDAELVNGSHALFNAVKDKLALHAGGSMDTQAVLSQHPDWRAFRVWKGSSLLLQSGNSASKDAQKAPPNFSNKEFRSESWRTYALYVQQEDIVVEVSENLLGRKLLAQSIFKSFLVSAVILLPLLALLLFFCIRFGLNSLTDIERKLRERGAETLGLINVDTLPKELKPLLQAINFLLEKLRNKITAEKQLIDNAAHELRTPLAAIKLHAQLASESTNEKDRAESMSDLLTTVDSTAAMLEQLLSLSRLSVEQVRTAPVMLYGVAEAVVSERKASAKEMRWEISGDQNAIIHSDERLLHILVGVLLDNAMKYSPENGFVKIAVGEKQLEIADNGPGIPVAEREKVFERFYRGNSKEPGHGLGLAIAKQICELLRATISLDDAPGGGLLVKLTFQA